MVLGVQWGETGEDHTRTAFIAPVLMKAPDTPILQEKAQGILAGAVDLRDALDRILTRVRGSVELQADSLCSNDLAATLERIIQVHAQIAERVQELREYI